MGCCNSKPETQPVNRPAVDHAKPPPNQKAEEKKPAEPKPEPAKLLHFQCKNGHDLTWASHVHFKYSQLNDTWVLRCDRCKSIYSGPGYHCEECSYNLCETCSSSHSKAKITLFCEKSHELLWCPEITFKYDANFWCNLCKGVKHEPAWHCHICSYDVCLKCGVNSGLSPPDNYIYCKEENHFLDFLEKRNYEVGESHLCDLCKAEIDETQGRLTCQEHDYDVCLNCADNRLKEMVPHPGFQCVEYKSLKIQKRKEVEENTGDEIQCSVCKKDQFESGYICEDCLTVYCFSCAAEIHRKILSAHKKTCASGHQLSWRNCSLRETKNFMCKVCSQKHSKGVFLCADCNYNVCIGCFTID